MYFRRKLEIKHPTLGTRGLLQTTSHEHKLETQHTSILPCSSEDSVCSVQNPPYTTQRNAGLANWAFQPNPRFYLENIYKYINFTDNAPTFQPLRTHFVIVLNLTRRAEAGSLRAPFMEKSEDSYKFLILQACFLPNVSPPAGYVLLVQLHPAL